MKVYYKFWQTSQTVSLSAGDKTLMRLLSEGLTKVHVEQLGLEASAEIGPQRSTTLLRLSLSEDTWAKIQNYMRKKHYGKKDPQNLFELGLGPEPDKK